MRAGGIFSLTHVTASALLENSANSNNRQQPRHQTGSILHEKRQFLVASGGEINTSLVSLSLQRSFVGTPKARHIAESIIKDKGRRRSRERDRKNALAAQERELCKPI